MTEGHGWFLKRYDRTRALQFLAMVEDMGFQVLVELPLRDLARRLAGLSKAGLNLSGGAVSQKRVLTSSFRAG